MSLPVDRCLPQLLLLIQPSMNWIMTDQQRGCHDFCEQQIVCALCQSCTDFGAHVWLISRFKSRMWCALTEASCFTFMLSSIKSQHCLHHEWQFCEILQTRLSSRSLSPLTPSAPTPTSQVESLLLLHHSYHPLMIISDWMSSPLVFLCIHACSENEFQTK